MPFNDAVLRAQVESLLRDQVTPEILAHTPQASSVMQLARRLPNMSAAQVRQPVLSALTTAYFVSGDTGLKQTTDASWENTYIDAEELAVIVPFPEAVLADSNYDIVAEVKPMLVEAFGKAIDQAVLYGTNIPTTWTTNLGAAGIVARIAAASHNVSLANYTDMYEATLGENAAGTTSLFGLVEADGFMVTGSIAHLTMKAKLRNLRDANGGLIFSSSMQQAGAYTLDGAPCLFPTNGAISGTYYLIAGQWNQLVYAIRQDVTFKLLDQAVITDAQGAIVYNLPQQDMIALRAVMRLGFALPNPINRVNPTAATRCPFAYLTA